ncbi:hypothetical protein E1281_25550 [Actinomadura sp. KC345]|uniref:DUF6183 family protein n=1 Tax=Actinomadura sp. KC345 TaxID=2530371 RepID=UPI001044BE7D|nr:DUF6183 family protein [Actinomadura sp. KC345]TDC47914.1 hypothetical protein E1281_25550 [Actinomadura sp. KC345]
MQIEEAIRRMGMADDHRDPHWNTAVRVTRVVQKADPGWLEELLFALLEAERPTFPMRAAFAEALRRLATAPGDADRVTTVRLLAEEGLGWADVRYELADVAEWLASAQPLGPLLAVFTTAEASDELAACLLHETVLRHDAPSAAGFAARLRAAGHPLGDLPLRRAPSERDHGMPWYPGLPKPHWTPPSPGKTPVPGPRDPAVTATELDWPGARLALSAHRAWVAADSECTEARLFLLDRPITPAGFGASVLRALPADSADGDLDGPYRVKARAVLRKLFSGASGGSAYGPGMKGANARLASWEALAALAGAEDYGITGTDTAAVEELAAGCTWLFYTSDWHLQVIPPLDVGIAVLRPDGRTIAVLAATDAD